MAGWHDLAAALFLIGLGNFVLFLDRRKLLNRLFLLLSLWLAYWAFCQFMVGQSHNMETARKWFKAVALWPFMGALVAHIALVFTERYSWLKSKWIYVALYGPPAVFSVVEITTDWMISPREARGSYINEVPQGSPVYGYLMAWVALSIAATVYVTSEYYLRVTDKKKKLQAKYMLLGICSLFVGGVLELVLMGVRSTGVLDTTTLGLVALGFFIGYGIWQSELFVLNPATAAENILSTMPDALFLADPAGRLMIVNEALLRLLGYKRGELLHDSVERLFDADSSTGIVEQMLAEQVAPNTESRLRSKSGHVVWVSFSSSVVRNRDNDVVGMVGIAADITERKRAEEQLLRTAEELARSNRDLELFAYLASHDLQEPLRMIASYVQLLSRRYKSKLDADADEFMNYAVDGANRMQALINGLLEYSRVETRGTPLQTTNAASALNSALRNLQLAIEEAHALVTSDELPMVVADQSQLAQLFQNLVANSIKFRGTATPQVHISVRSEGTMRVFSVRDNGIGIDPKDFDKIFVMFQRLHNRADYAGHGIGLALCRRIVERHGGTLWVQESAAGQGTTFSFTLPGAHSD